MRIVRAPLSPAEVQAFADEIFGGMIKVVVDVRRGLLVAGAVQHADGERQLLEMGSSLDDIWGANVFPSRAAPSIEYASMINQDRAANRGHKVIQDPATQARVAAVIRQYFPSLNHEGA
ncbi:MAG: hypothetical protein HY600_04060 [Candidatus Omnitrophica bacterium]|nr:hypothetical protein [Candidatus Omnitrophota bacterium]